MKRIYYSFFILLILSIATTSAFTLFGNEPRYSQDNLTVELKDYFLGIPTKDIGTIRLGSHTSADAIKWVEEGDQVVMWYQVNFKEIYSNGLGDVKFIDQRTGASVNKPYQFVYLVNESRTVTEHDCSTRDKDGNCDNPLFTYTEYEQVWKDYNTKEIPEGDITIGLKVYVEDNEYMDAIWTIADVEISRHAYWREQDAVTQAHGVDLSSSSTTTLALRGMNITVNSTNITLVNLTKHASSATNGTACVYYGGNATGGSAAAPTPTTGRYACAAFSGDTATFSTAPFNNVTLYAGQKYAVVVWSNGAIRFAGTTYPITNQYVTWTKGIYDGFATQNDEANEIVSIGVAPQLTGSTIVVNTPVNNSNHTSSNVLLNVSVTDALGVSNVTLFIDGAVSVTNTSGVNGVYLFNTSLSRGTHTFSIGAKNTANEVSNSSTYTLTVDWIFKVNESYSASILEGGTSTFRANFTTNGSTVTIANLTYNVTGNVATITAINSTLYQASRTLTAPSVTANTNINFSWNVTLDTGFYKNFSNNTQTVLNFNVDNCSTNTAVLYNFTVVDEESTVKLSPTADNTTGRVDLQIYNLARTTQIANFSSLYNRTNSFSVCLTSNLSQGESYVIDAIVEYSALNHAQEFYNIQNETLTNADFPTNITLYDLDSADSQVFTIIFRDSSFLTVADALIQVQRKYISDGVFRTVEIPKTDANGETIAHLVLNDVIYNFVVVKYGVVLGSFNNVVAVCQTPEVSECIIDFNAFSSGVEVPDYETGDDFNYTLTYNRTSRLVQSIFVIPSGDPALVYLNVSREDALGTSVCTDSLTSAAGTLSCTVPSNFGNATVLAQLYKGGVLQAQGQFKLDQNPNDIYGDSGTVVLGIFVFIMLVGAGLALAGDNPVIFIVCLMVGVIGLFGLNLVANNGFIGATATILFLIIAIILVLIKIARRN